jgi:hypothetical protein
MLGPGHSGPFADPPLGGCVGEFALTRPSPTSPRRRRSRCRRPLSRSCCPADLLLVTDDTASMAQSGGAREPVLGAARRARRAGGWHRGGDHDMAGRRRAGCAIPVRAHPEVPAVEARLRRWCRSGPTAGGGGARGGGRGVCPRGSGGLNAGFRRPDALLHVVFVSDADDQSATGWGRSRAGVPRRAGTPTGRPARRARGAAAERVLVGTGMAQPAVSLRGGRKFGVVRPSARQTRPGPRHAVGGWDRLADRVCPVGSVDDTVRSRSTACPRRLRGLPAVPRSRPQRPARRERRGRVPGPVDPVTLLPPSPRPRLRHRASGLKGRPLDLAAGARCTRLHRRRRLPGRPRRSRCGRSIWRSATARSCPAATPRRSGARPRSSGRSAQRRAGAPTATGLPARHHRLA